MKSLLYCIVYLFFMHACMRSSHSFAGLVVVEFTGRFRIACAANVLGKLKISNFQSFNILLYRNYFMLS